MNQNEIITATVVLMVCGLIAGTTAIPLIAGISQETINEEYNDETLAGWVRMAYGADDFDVSIEADAGTINAGGQTGTVDSIVYADDKLSVYATGDKLTIVNGYATTPAVVEATNVQITNADGAISVVADGDTIVSGDSPAWAYYPDASGKYAYFDASNEGIKVKDGITPAYVGNFAGVWAYNGTVVAPNDAGDLGLSLNAVVENGAVSSVTWAKVQPTNLGGSAQMTPLNASYGPDPTTGTRIGDLYYTFSGSNATVIGYASTIDWSTFTSISDTVVSDGTTYTITSIGTSAFYGCTSLALTSLPSGLNSIGNNAFSGCTSLALTSLPSGLTSIGQAVFNNCPNLALSSLPAGIRNIGNNAFYGCTSLALTSLPSGLNSIGRFAFNGDTSLKSLIIQSQPTIGDEAFFNCNNLKTILNLGTLDINAGSSDNGYIANYADEVRSDVPALGYIAPLSINEVVTKTGAVFEIIGLLPLIMVLGVVMVGVYMIGRRYA